ncbi:Sm-like protein Lsm7 [Sesbania bispinosa]|nr:Sm-like protein Lsm7 [Sesbania bispinosa]
MHIIDESFVRPSKYNLWRGHSRIKSEKQRLVDSTIGRKETVLDLAKFVDKGVQVKLTGGRQVTGTLKGYDQLLNLVLDEAVEFLRDPDDPLKTTDQTRNLGLIVCRGTAVMLVSPTDGTDEIANPFLQPDGA